MGGQYHTPYPPPQTGSDIEVMMSHMHQEGVKRFIIHITRLSGESRAGIQAHPLGLSEGGGEWLWFLVWVEDGAVVKIPARGLGCLGFELSHQHRGRECPAFLIGLLDGGQKAKRGKELESCQKSNIKNET